MRKTIILQILAAICALITIIVIGAMPGEKTEYWLPILILCIISLIVLILAAVFSFLDDRNEEDGWTGCSEMIENLILLILNAVAILILLGAVIVYILALTNSGMTIGETHMVAENDREANMPIGTCDNINMEHSYCDGHQEECFDYVKFCMSKTNDHPTQVSGMVFLIITLIVVVVTTIILIISKREYDDDGEPLNNTVSYKGGTGRQAGQDWPVNGQSMGRNASGMQTQFSDHGSNGHQSPLV